MLVSELSAGYSQVNNKPFNNGISYHAADGNEAKIFEVYSPNYQTEKKTLQENTSSDRYDAINEWKYFCYNQVVGKKLNILA